MVKGYAKHESGLTMGWMHNDGMMGLGSGSGMLLWTLIAVALVVGVIFLIVNSKRQ
jgi:hypothetical protein